MLSCLSNRDLTRCATNPPNPGTITQSLSRRRYSICLSIVFMLAKVRIFCLKICALGSVGQSVELVWDGSFAQFWKSYSGRSWQTSARFGAGLEFA